MLFIGLQYMLQLSASYVGQQFSKSGLVSLCLLPFLYRSV